MFMYVVFVIVVSKIIPLISHTFNSKIFNI